MAILAPRPSRTPGNHPLRGRYPTPSAFSSASKTCPASTTFLRRTRSPPNQITRLKAESLLESENLSMLKHVLHPPPSLDSVVKLKLPGLPFSEATDTSKRSMRTMSRLARVTVYWPEEGDFYTRNYRSSTGVRLRDGHCAVDPKVIPYGSVISVPGVGELLAVDTGSAVVSRRAARAAGRTTAQRNAIVIDVFCSSRSKARALIKRVSRFAVVSWQPPGRLSDKLV